MARGGCASWCEISPLPKKLGDRDSLCSKYFKEMAPKDVLEKAWRESCLALKQIYIHIKETEKDLTR